MSIKINTINVEPGDTFIITHNGSAEAPLSIVAFKDGIRVCGPRNSERKEFYFSKKGVKAWEEV